MKPLVLLLGVLLWACDATPLPTREVSGHSVRNTPFPPPALIAPCDDVEVLYNGVAQAEGTVLADPYAVVIQNGRVRLEYGAGNTERGGDFQLKAVHADPSEVIDPVTEGIKADCAGCHNGHHWHDVNHEYYGDYVNYVTPPTTHPDRVHVLRADGDVVELSFEWDVRPVTVTARAFDGSPLWVRGSAEDYRFISSIKMWRTVRIERCGTGYYTALRSDPYFDEFYDDYVRGFGISWSSAVVWDSDGQVARHPQAGAHVNFGTASWFADIPVEDEGGHGWPYIRVVASPAPRRLLSLQYGVDYPGTPMFRDMQDVIGPEGRPLAYQGYFGFREYVSPDPALEPTQAAQDLVDAVLSDIAWPR
jgi:hypothetical protein